MYAKRCVDRAAARPYPFKFLSILPLSWPIEKLSKSDRIRVAGHTYADDAPDAPTVRSRAPFDVPFAGDRFIGYKNSIHSNWRRLDGPYHMYPGAMYRVFGLALALADTYV